MFGERKTKLTLLSLLSALVVISTASVGVSIYAQEAGVDDSELTTFEEEELMAEQEDDDAETSSADNATDDGTTIAEVRTLFDGLVVCDAGEVTVDEPETETAGLDDATAATPTVSVSIMTETEVAAIATNETETASADDETETASADCFRIGGADDDDEETSTSGDAAEADMDATPMGDNNATSSANATDGSSELTTFEEEAMSGEEEASNDTSVTMPASDASLLETEQQIMVIEGQDFAPGQVVLVFSSNALLAIDEVDEEGSIDAKVPVTEVDNEIRFVESGTMRTADFAFDGETLISAEGVGEIQAESAEEDESMTATTPSGDAASANNSTDEEDDMSSNSTEQ